MGTERYEDEDEDERQGPETYRLFVYGSAKLGCYFWPNRKHRWDEVVPRVTCTLKGFKLLEIGSPSSNYPALVRSENPDDVVVGELLTFERKPDGATDEPTLYAEAQFPAKVGEMYYLVHTAFWTGEINFPPGSRTPARVVEGGNWQPSWKKK